MRTYTAAVTVQNVAPTATFTGDTVVEGTPATVRFSEPFDPSPADRESGLRYEYDLDGDGTFEPGGASATVPTTNGPATLHIRGAIVDRDNARTEYTATVVVTNAAPTASIAGPQTVPVKRCRGAHADRGRSLPVGRADRRPGLGRRPHGDHRRSRRARGRPAPTRPPAITRSPTRSARSSRAIASRAPRASASTARHTLSVASLPAPRVNPTPEPTPDPRPTPAPTTAPTPPAGGVAGVTVDASRCGSAASSRHAALRARGATCAPTIAGRAARSALRFQPRARRPRSASRWCAGRTSAVVGLVPAGPRASPRPTAGASPASTTTHSKRAVEARAGADTASPWRRRTARASGCGRGRIS